MHVKAIQLIHFGPFTFPNPVSPCTQGCWGQLEYMGHRKTKTHLVCKKPNKD